MEQLRFLLKRKLVVGLMVLFIVFIGLFTTTKLDQELMPPITFDGAMVQVDAGEMTTLDIENTITKPIEQAIQSIDGIKSITSSSSIGSSAFTIQIEEGRGEEVTKNIESTLNGIKTQLPDLRTLTVIPFSTTGSYEFFMDISNGNMNDMTSFAKNTLKPRLESLAEVSKVDLVGLEEKEMVIELRYDKIQEFGIDVNQVISAIQQADQDIAIGVLSDEVNEPTIRWNTSIRSKPDLENIAIATLNGPQKISDFAVVKEKVSDHSTGVWKNGDQDFIFVQISRVPDVTQVAMAKAIRSEIQAIKDEGLVTQFELEEVVAQADYVSDAIEGVSKNVLIGGVLALVFLLLFLRNIRATIIVGLSIPISILLTFTVMWYFDYSFNMLSLIGLGLGIGMMVDASIVILESIFRKKEQGIANIEAVIQGTKEVATAVIASMLTTIVVFVPIGLLGGEAGKFMVILSVVVIITLVSSVVVSFSVIPALCDNFLRISAKKEKHKPEKISFIYGSFVQWMGLKKRNRYSVISLFIIMFVSSLFLVSKIPMTIMPDVFNRYAEVMIQLEPGVTPSERNEIATAISKQLKDVPDVTNTIIMDDISAMYAIINMSKAEEATLDQIEVNELIYSSLRELEDEYPIVNVLSPMGMGGGGVVALELKGAELPELQTLSTEVMEQLAEVEGLTGITASSERFLTEKQVILKGNSIEEDNLIPTQLKQILELWFTALPLGNLITPENEMQRMVLTVDQSITTESQLLGVEWTTPTGTTEQLSKYIDFKTVEIPAEITRVDGERYITVSAEIQGRDLGSVNRDIQNILNDFKAPEGYTISISGDLEAQQEAMMEMIIIVGIALFLVYFVMAVQFNSLTHPLIVMSIIPMTITGVIIGLFVTQFELSIMSGMGIVMLIGIVLNNAILLIDRINQLRKSDVDVNTAVSEAGRTRMRPILMTTLTTVGGMLPLALATGVASSYQAPLAVVVISGLLFATLITLILIPAVYLMFGDFSNAMSKMKNKIRKGKGMDQVNSSVDV